MRKELIVSLLPALFLLFLAPYSARPLASHAAPASVSDENDSDVWLITALDECIQERFKDVDQMFGFRRITKTPSPHRFLPENAKELQSVGELKKARLNVVLYLAGRRLLGPEPDKTAWTDARLSKPIRGPVFVNWNGRQDADVPDPAGLWAEGQKAMRRFSQADSYAFTAGKWKFVARPVRASDQSCLKCHTGDHVRMIPARQDDQIANSLQIGDPLGVLFYAYDRAR